MTEAVLADAQFGTVKVYKPFANFEADYQGVDGDTPIAIPGDLDSDAGKEGFDPNLISGIPVPYGSKVVLWLPTIFIGDGSIGFPYQPIEYYYQIIFRLRNLRDFRENRSAYHFPRQSLGQNEQFVIPAAKKVVLFEENRYRFAFTANAGDNKATFNQTITSFESLTPDTLIRRAPIVKGGQSAALQQGLGSGIASNNQVTYDAVTLDAEGDEMIILVSKILPQAGSTVETWDFQGVDKGFSDFYGNGAGGSFSDLGVYVTTGSNP